ncbi:LysR family transcriptional regulator [Kitasatospora sp. NPDC015120]|uniref:LysR family transcriptional regulator n=1 Tax=Kitasatospora sp. NPDC015120 TaxID=3364023 RepID=UPI0036F4AC7C
MEFSLHLARLLVTVVDEGHFGRAAQRLFISTPALSQQIRKLERGLGVDLVDRSAHPVRATAAGERFLVHARASIAAADRAMSAVEAYRRECAGTLRIGFISAATGPHFRPLLDRLRRGGPASSVQLVELAWAEQASAVRDGRVDASFMRPPVADATGLRFDVLFHEPRVVALPATHRLAGRESVSLGDLDDEPHVTDDEADPEWVRWWACDPRPSGRPVSYGPSVRTITELLEVVASGEAVAITGALVAEVHRRPDVVFVPVADIEPTPLSLCTRSDDLSSAVAEVRRVAREYARGVEP